MEQVRQVWAQVTKLRMVQVFGEFVFYGKA